MLSAQNIWVQRQKGSFAKTVA